MTISRHIYQRGMSVMQDFFGRTFEPPTMAVLYDALSRELDDAEFERAVQLTVASERFFPPLDVFIGKVRPPINYKLLAEGEYERVLRACRRHSWQRALSEETFGYATNRSIDAAGGIRAVALAEPDAAPHNRRRFIEAYVDFAAQEAREEAAQIGSTQHGQIGDARVRQLVSDTAKNMRGV